MNMPKASRVKLVLMAIAVILVVIIVLRNLNPVPVDILGYKAELPTALLLIVTLAIGCAAGLVTAGLWGTKKKRP